MNRPYISGLVSRKSCLSKLSAFVLAFLLLVSPLIQVYAEEVQTSDQPSDIQQESIYVDIPLKTQEPEIPVTNEVDTSPDAIQDGIPELDSINDTKIDEDIKDDNETKDPEQMAMRSVAANSATSSLATNSDSKVLRPNVDQSTGALIYEYPIEVPNGFNKQNPNLKLTYNSQETRNDSAFGYGWSSSIPYIERVNKHGVNDLYSGSNIDFASSMFGELVQKTSTTYVPKSASDIVSLSFSSNVWTYVDKDGTTYVFGSSASERQNDPSNSSNIYKWMLTSVTDSNGNAITYTYTKDQGQIYPDTISYGGIYQISFTKITRNETVDSYKEGFHVITAKIVSEIDFNVSSTLKKKYVLTYGTGDNGARSVLTSIQASAYDSSSNLTTQPSTTFAYSTRSTPSWSTSGSLTFPSGTDLLNGHSMAVDFNGDGYTDILTSWSDPNSNVTQVAKINNGDGTWTTSTPYQPPVVFYYETGAGISKDYMSMDLNGDQLPDLFRSVMECVGFTCALSSTIYMNTGSGWSLSTDTIPMALHYLGTTKADMVDFNGDGLPDIYASAGNYNGNVYPRKIYLNNGDGTWLDDTANWTFPFSSGTPHVIFTDINGDGIVDIINDGWYWTGSACGCTTYVGTSISYIGDGKGTFTSSTPYTSPASYSFYPAGQPVPGYDWGNRAYDLNNDGLADLIYSRDPSSGPTTRSYTYFNTSNTWSSNNSAWALPAGSFKFSSGGNNTTGNPLDMDADGIPEAYEGGTLYKNTTANRTDLLTTITVPTGGTIAATYQSSNQYKDGSGNLLNPNLPFPIQTVKSVTTTDPVTSVSGTSNYVYSGGSYYYSTPSDRKFAGFEKVSESRPDTSVVINYYHQGNASSSGNYEYSDSVGKIGFIYRTDITNSGGTIQARSTTEYDTASPTTGAYFVYPIQTVDEINGKNTATAYSYNTTTGNLSSTTEYGKVTVSTPLSFTDTGSDLKTTNYTYATNGSGTYKVSDKEVLDQSSAKVSETKYYYDTQSLGTLTLGNNTKISQLKTGSTFIDMLQNAYNSYGHVTSSTDGRSKTTTYGYDANNLYVDTVTNPLSQVTSYVYEYNTGKPTQVTDQNGFVYETSYDGFGRPLEEKLPDLTTPATLRTKKIYSYTDTANAVAIHASTYLDGSNIVDSYQYFDGLGRVLQERNETESSFVAKDYAYTTSGQLQKESLPYVSSGSSKTSPTGTTTLYTNYTYDLLNRILTKIDNVGTTGYSYTGFQTTVTDPRTKIKDYYTDAYGNLAQVDEHNSGSTYTTTYAWNLNNKLTGITDALSNVRAFTYDNMGRRLTAEDLHASADATFGSWSYSYDDTNNITQSVNPEAKTVNYAYDDINRVLTENYTGGAGTEITYTYDSCTNGVGKLCATTMTSGADTAYTYNSNGGLASEAKTVNSTTYTTSYTYDRQGNQLIITYPDSAQVRYAYNNGGLLEKVEHKESGGSFSDVVSDIDYSPVSTPTSIIYVNGATTTNIYDATKLYRLTNKTTTTLNTSGGGPMSVNTLVVGGGGGVTGGFGGGGAGGYQANSAFSVTAQAYSITVGAGGTGFNNGGNSVFDTITALGGGAASDGSSAGQNGASGGGGYGNSTPPATGGTGTSGQGYNGGNGFGAGASTKGGGGGGASSAGTNASSGFGGNGGNGIANSISGTSVTYAGGGAGRAIVGTNGTPGTGGGGAVGSNGTNGLGGGAGGQVGGVDTTGGSGVVIIAYHTDGSDGVLTTSTGGTITTSGVYTIHTFTSSGTFTVNPASSGSIDAQNTTYTYDANGNITQIVDASDTDSSKTVNYVYDDLNRMTSATATSVAAGQSTYTHTYAYNAIGNITSGPVGSYVYGGSGGSLYANPHAPTSINSITNTYDKDGNNLTDGTLTNTWNYKDQLAQTVNGGTTLNYLYDYAGNRASYTDGTTTTDYANKYYNFNGTKKTKQVYAGNQLVATLETISSTVTPYYVHTDTILGSNVISDGAGALNQLLDYFPFGDTRINDQVTSFNEQKQFGGHILDSDTGLNYMNARYYGGNRSQFISQDPSFLSLGDDLKTKENTGKNLQEYLADPQALNSYSYAGNNPINKIDPTGKAFVVDDLAGLAIGGVVGVISKIGVSLFSKGTLPPPGEIVGSAVTGAIIGWGAINTPETLGASNVLSASMVAGFTGGFYGNLAEQTVDIGTGNQEEFNFNELNQSAAITGTTNLVLQGTVPNTKIPGLSSGQGNMNAVGQTMRTKAANGTISNMSVNTAIRSAVGSQAAEAGRTFLGMIGDAIKSIFNW